MKARAAEELSSLRQVIVEALEAQLKTRSKFRRKSFRRGEPGASSGVGKCGAGAQRGVGIRGRAS